MISAIPKKQVSIRKIIFNLIIFILVCVLVYLLVRKVKFENFISLVYHLSGYIVAFIFVYTIFLAFLCSFLQRVTFFIFSPSLKISFLKLWLMFFIWNMLTLVTPFSVGSESNKISYFYKKGYEVNIFMPGIIAYNIINLMTNICFVITSFLVVFFWSKLGFLFNSGDNFIYIIIPLILFSIFIQIAWMTIFLSMTFSKFLQTKIVQFFRFLTKRFPAKFQKKVLHFLNEVEKEAQLVRENIKKGSKRWTLFVFAFFLSIFLTLMRGLITWIALRNFLPQYTWTFISTMTLVIFAESANTFIPIPSGIGSFDVVFLYVFSGYINNVQSHSSLGVKPEDAATTLLIVTRFTVTIIPVIIGFIMYGLYILQNIIIRTKWK